MCVGEGGDCVWSLFHIFVQLCVCVCKHVESRKLSRFKDNSLAVFKALNSEAQDYRWVFFSSVCSSLVSDFFFLQWAYLLHNEKKKKRTCFSPEVIEHFVWSKYCTNNLGNKMNRLPPLLDVLIRYKLIDIVCDNLFIACYVSDNSFHFTSFISFNLNIQKIRSSLDDILFRNFKWCWWTCRYILIIVHYKHKVKIIGKKAIHND